MLIFKAINLKIYKFYIGKRNENLKKREQPAVNFDNLSESNKALYTYEKERMDLYESNRNKWVDKLTKRFDERTDDDISNVK